MSGASTARRLLAVLCDLPFAAILVLALAACGRADAEPDRPAKTRLVVAGSAAGELAVALGFAQSIVGADAAAGQVAGVPASAARVGYVRALPVEGLAALQPDVVLATAEAGPPEALDQLARLGVAVHVLPDGHGAGAVVARTLAAGEALACQERAHELAASLREGASESSRRIADARAAEERVPRALWLLQPGGGSALVGGRGTAADALIAAAGGDNAAAALEGWKPLAREALWGARPELIVVASPRVTPGELDGAALVAAFPELDGAPWLASARGVALESGALGGGPSFVRHAERLAALLHPTAAPSGAP